MNANDIVIVAAKRTPTGTLLGQLSSLSAPQLSAVATRSALLQAGLASSCIDEVMMGCVLQAGIGQAPARQAAIYADIPVNAGATTINKMCGSGMQAVIFAHDAIVAGSCSIVLAGGMESMSNAPYLLQKARAGCRVGHGEMKDHIFLDGLEDAYTRDKLMGYFADATAAHLSITREMQDDFAARSMTRALFAEKNGYFAEELAPVAVSVKNQTINVLRDEAPDAAKLAKIPVLKPAFCADGTVTAGNSSSIADGAASLILMTYANAQKHGITPLARIVAHARHAQAPEWFTTAPAVAIRKVLNKAGWQSQDVDLYEINEAFAVVAMAAISTLELNDAKVNIHGGACALGHPIGASGARILVTLLYALKQQNLRRGVASLCIGGGEATAVAIEVIR